MISGLVPRLRRELMQALQDYGAFMSATARPSQAIPAA